MKSVHVCICLHELYMICIFNGTTNTHTSYIHTQRCHIQGDMGIPDYFMVVCVCARPGVCLRVCVCVCVHVFVSVCGVHVFIHVRCELFSVMLQLQSINTPPHTHVHTPTRTTQTLISLTRWIAAPYIVEWNGGANSETLIYTHTYIYEFSYVYMRTFIHVRT